MIVKISEKSGKSFKGLTDYLTHDKDKAKTHERVAWTDTLNLAEHDIPSAVNLMYLTAENAELLKQEAGVRGGGRAAEHPVKHISLNWHEEDNPSQQHMIATAKHFLKSMGWDEHQAILVGHRDKPYRHVHIILNEVHPDTGLLLKDGYEQRRAQEWAAAYELEQGNIRCEQRLKNERDREQNMPRNIWMEFQASEQEFTRTEKILAEKSPEIPEKAKNAEWEILKEFQREERIAFFAQGKMEFSELRKSVYREVREEFRERWGNYYRAAKNGTDDDRKTLADVKAQLLAEQKAVLEERRDAACKELRAERDTRYRELLDGQKEKRAELRWHQEIGADAAPFLNELESRKNARPETRSSFRAAAGEVTRPEPISIAPAKEMEADASHDERIAPARDAEPRFGPRLVAPAKGFLDALFFDLINLGSARPEPLSAREQEDLFREAAENTTKQHQQRAKDDEDEQWRERQKGRFGE